LIKDNTTGRAAEKGLTRDEQQLRFITNSLPALVSYIDREERYRFVNQAHAAWFGRTQEEISGRLLKEVFAPDLYDRLKPQIDAALAGKEIQYEMWVPHQGSQRYLKMSYIPSFDSANAVQGFIGLGLDETERKHAEQEKERLSSLVFNHRKRL